MTDSSFISQKTQLHLGVCLTTGYWPLTLQATSSTPGGRFNHPAAGELNFPRARRQGKYRNRNRATKESHPQTVSQYLSLQNTVHSAPRLWEQRNRSRVGRSYGEARPDWLIVPNINSGWVYEADFHMSYIRQE